MADKIVRDFDALQRDDLRMEVLEKIVDRLRADERLRLGHVLNRKNDPLFLLPIELVLNIFLHLNIFDPWRLQLVCRNWRKVLSSEFIQRHVLSTWTYDDRLDRGLTGIEPCSTKTIRSRVRNIQAARLGRPFSYLTIDGPAPGILPERTAVLTVPTIVLNGSTLAYLCGEGQRNTRVAIHFLLSGRRVNLHGRGREHLQCLALTDTHVAFAGFSGHLYVWKLDDVSDKYSYRLPNCGVRGIYGDSDIFAAMIWFDANNSQWGREHCILVLNATTKQMRSIQLPYSDITAILLSKDIWALSLLVGKQRRTIDAFFSVDHSSGIFFMHIRIPFDDDLSLNGDMAINVLGCDDVLERCAAYKRSVDRWDPQIEIGELRPTGYKDIYELNPFLVDRHHQDYASYTFGGLRFDAGRGLLLYERHLWETRPPSKALTTQAYRWKDMLYSFSTRFGVDVYHGREYLGEKRGVKFNNQPTEPRAKPWNCPVGAYKAQRLIGGSDLPGFVQLPICHSRPCFMLFNDTFWVQVSVDDDPPIVVVYCFDEKVAMADGSSTGLWDERDVEYRDDDGKVVKRIVLPFTTGPGSRGDAAKAAFKELVQHEAVLPTRVRRTSTG